MDDSLCHVSALLLQRRVDSNAIMKTAVIGNTGGGQDLEGHYNRDCHKQRINKLPLQEEDKLAGCSENNKVTH